MFRTSNTFEQGELRPSDNSIERVYFGKFGFRIERVHAVKGKLDRQFINIEFFSR